MLLLSAAIFPPGPSATTKNPMALVGRRHWAPSSCRIVCALSLLRRCAFCYSGLSGTGYPPVPTVKPLLGGCLSGGRASPPPPPSTFDWATTSSLYLFIVAAAVTKKHHDVNQLPHKPASPNCPRKLYPYLYPQPLARRPQQQYCRYYPAVSRRPTAGGCLAPRYPEAHLTQVTARPCSPTLC